MKSNLLVVLSCMLLNMSLQAQKITAYDQFHGTKSLSKVNVEDDLYLRFDLANNLSKIAQEQGVLSTNSIYAVIKMTLGNAKLSTGTMLLAVGKTSLINSFDLALSVNHKQFHAVVAQHKENWSAKDDLLMKVMAQPQNPMNSWIKLLSARMLEGEGLEAKIELFLCNSAEDTKTKGKAIAVGTFQVKADKTALMGMYGTRIPAMNRPMSDNGITNDLHKKNIGNIRWSKAESKAKALSYTYGSEVIAGNLYLAKSVGNTAKSLGMFNQCELLVEVSIGGEDSKSVAYPLDRALCSKETILPLLFDDPIQQQGADTKLNPLQKQLSSLMKNKKTGTYQVDYKVYCTYLNDANQEKIELASAQLNLIKK